MKERAFHNSDEYVCDDCSKTYQCSACNDWKCKDLCREHSMEAKGIASICMVPTLGALLGGRIESAARRENGVGQRE